MACMYSFIIIRLIAYMATYIDNVENIKDIALHCD